LLNQAQEIVSSVKDEEQDALDNLPENLQNSERAENMSDAISVMEEVEGSIQEASDTLDDVICD
jgi:hypothetical protein